MARPTDEQAALIRDRRTKALQLRVDGMPLAEIGKRLHADNGFPMGYTADRAKTKQLTSAVAKDLGQSIRDRYKANKEAAGDLAAELLGRLELMWAAVEDEIAAGNLRAIDVGLRIVERAARLTGAEVSALDRLGPDGVQRVEAAFVILTEAVSRAGTQAGPVE